MTEAQLIRHNHDQTEMAWNRAAKQWRSDPEHQAAFPDGERDCKAGAALCREIKRDAI